MTNTKNSMKKFTGREEDKKRKKKDEKAFSTLTCIIVIVIIIVWSWHNGRRGIRLSSQSSSEDFQSIKAVFQDDNETDYYSNQGVSVVARAGPKDLEFHHIAFLFSLRLGIYIREHQYTFIYKDV